MNLIDANNLDLVGVGIFGLAAHPIKTYRVTGSDRTHLLLDRGPNQFKMVAIENGNRGEARWIARHLVH